MVRLCWGGVVIAAFIGFSLQVRAEQPAMGQEQIQSSESAQDNPDKKSEALKASDKLRQYLKEFVLQQEK